jgi:hypothetical protein
MNVIATLGIIFLLAFLVETLIEFLFGTLAGFLVAVFPLLEGKLGTFKTPIIQIFAIAAGIIGAFIYQFDVLYLLGMFLVNPIPITVYGLIITGVAIGKGSNYIHQLITQFFPVKA